MEIFIYHNFSELNRKKSTKKIYRITVTLAITNTKCISSLERIVNISILVYLSLKIKFQDFYQRKDNAIYWNILRNHIRHVSDLRSPWRDLQISAWWCGSSAARCWGWGQRLRYPCAGISLWGLYCRRRYHRDSGSVTKHHNLRYQNYR